jgi:hypothetical protein
MPRSNREPIVRRRGFETPPCGTLDAIRDRRKAAGRTRSVHPVSHAARPEKRHRDGRFNRALGNHLGAAN